MSVFTEKQLEAFIKEINDCDLRKMFGSAFFSVIKAQPQETVEEKLTNYWAYKVPVSIGDVIEIDKVTYTVTCIYTDNSVDLLSKNGATKVNKGLYAVDVKKVGKLQCITE